MDGHPYLELAAIFVLIIANGLFVLAEFAIIASRKTKLKQELDDRKPGAATALKVHDNPESFLAAMQIGITLLGALVGVFSGATIVDRLHVILSSCSIEMLSHWARPLSVLTVVITITVLSVVLGELVPKYIALSFPEKYARKVAGPVLLFIKGTYVFTRLLSGIAKAVLRVLGVKHKTIHTVVNEDEINHMILEGRERGLFDVTEEEFVKSVFQFTDNAVHRAMRPRPDVIALDVESTGQEIQKIIIENGYSRYPVYRESIDNVIGLVYVKDLIKEGQDLAHIDLVKIMRRPLFVPDAMPLTTLLREFQSGKNHLAIVLDEYGGTAGIITLEDILEELVGEIQDEYDSEAPPVVKHSDTIAYASGSVWPGEINELLGCELPEDQSDTLAGLFFDTVGHMPEKYQTITLADTRLTILSKDKHRILRLKVEKVARASTDRV